MMMDQYACYIDELEQVIRDILKDNCSIKMQQIYEKTIDIYASRWPDRTLPLKSTVYLIVTKLGFNNEVEMNRSDNTYQRQNSETQYVYTGVS